MGLDGMSGPASQGVERLLEMQPRLARVLDIRPQRRAFEASASVTARQLDAVTQLPRDGRTMRQFADAVGISGAAATARADRLVTQGLAERRPDPDDRRTVWLVPTERAMALAEQYHAWRRQMMAAVMRRLDVEQMIALEQILVALAESGSSVPAEAAWGEPDLRAAVDADELRWA